MKSVIWWVVSNSVVSDFMIDDALCVAVIFYLRVSSVDLEIYIKALL